MYKLHLGLLLALSLAACGTSGISIGDYPGKLADAYCTSDVKCGTQPDATTCKASTVFAGNDYESTLAAIKKGTIKYDEGAAADCVDSNKNTTCLFDGVHGSGDSPCSHVFTGTIPSGGACEIDLECANNAPCTQTDSNCDRQTACCPGTCGMAPGSDKAIGATCKDSSECVATAYCKPPATGNGDGACAALVTAEGAACDDLYACADPMLCDIFADMPVCETSAPSGGACKPAYLFPCADSREYCDATTMKCVKNAAVGAACSNTISCVNYASCLNSVCVAAPGLGQPCSDMTPDCLGSLSCVSGTCQAPAAGMSCIAP